MILNNLIQQDDNKQVIENPKSIEFSNKTVRFGDCIYQLRNITGFKVGELPKQKLQILLVAGSIAGFLFFLTVGQNGFIGFVFLAIAGWILFSHFTQLQKYGFILELNSGNTTSFVSDDRRFLGNIVTVLYKLMEGDIEGTIIANWNDRTVNVYGAVTGAISTGENAHNTIRNNTQIQ